jgi:two-component system OmpR family sensor kinase
VSLRARITLLTAILLLASSTALGVVAVVTALRIQIDAVDRSVAMAVNDPRVRGLLDRTRPAPEGERIMVAVGVRAPGRSDVTVVRAAGTAEEPLPFPVLDPALLQAALTGPITVDGPVEYRVVARELRPGGAVIVAASPLTDVRADVRTFTLGMASAVIAITALGALLAWLAVRRFFRPMDHMVDAARGIGRGDLERRVPSAPQGTELGVLAESLNAMIASLTSTIQRAEASEARLRSLVSDASHEIRTPLTVIRGYVELLLRDASDSRDDLSSRALRRIDTESERLQRLVDSLLALDRIDRTAGRVPQPVDLARLVEDALADLEGLDPARPIQADLDAATLMADEDALRQLLANLVQNIVRHTPSGSPVTVSLTAHGAGATLIVDDSGPGIAPEDRERALERFSRIGATVPGSGIGLAIVNSVVAAHSGTITLTDSPAGGLRVRIDLPGGRAGL